MSVNWKSLLSAFGVPLLGLSTLIGFLGHPSITIKTTREDPSMMLLVDPDPKLDKSLTICLRQQAKEVALFRKRAQSDRLAHAVADYNLVASECTPAVFEATHLPVFIER